MAVGTLDARDEARLRKGIDFRTTEGGLIRLELHAVTSMPVITFAGKIMGDKARDAADTMLDLLDKIPGYIVMDLGGCEYMSSTSLGFIARLAMERHEDGYDLFICGVGQKMRWLMSVLDMDEFFHFRESVEDAVSDAIVRGRR